VLALCGAEKGTPLSQLAHRHRAAFTLFEMMIVVAIIGIIAAAALPAFVQYQRNQAMRAVMRDAAGYFGHAKSLAMAENRPHIVFFNTGNDNCTNPITDSSGNPVPILVIDDGDGDCCIDAGERVDWLRVPPLIQADVNWGVTAASSRAPGDVGAGPSWATTGTSFTRPSGTVAHGVLFRTDGVPVTYSPTCAAGTTGSGGGALYVTNTQRDYALVLSPLGAASIERWNPTTSAWGN
jgi:prepilin-type N-terminal cleavage/methylation domain-containing protein